MAEAIGNEVVALRRVRFGPIELGGLAEGEARRLSERGGRRLRRASSSSDLDDDGPLARPVVEVDQDDLLPGARARGCPSTIGTASEGPTRVAR